MACKQPTKTESDKIRYRGNRYKYVFLPYHFTNAPSGGSARLPKCIRELGKRGWRQWKAMKGNGRGDQVGVEPLRLFLQ